MDMWNRVGTVVGPAALAAMAIGLAGFQGTVMPASDTAPDRGSAQRQTDETIKAKIEKRLRMDDRLDWEVLEVAVVNGHATLYGEVKTPEEKGLAALIASTVAGVNGLTNSILIEPAVSRDRQLAKAIWKALRTVPALDGNDTLRVRVKNAVAKLEGTVAHTLQKRAADKAAASVPGVTTVINLIEVSPQSPAGDITQLGNEKLEQEGVQLQP